MFFLLAPIIARIVPDHVGPLMITGPQDFHRFAYNIHVADALAALVALSLYASDRRHGRPFLLVAGLIAAHSLLFETVSRFDAWRRLFGAFASFPTALLVSLGLGAGAAIAWLGSAAAPARVRRTAPA